MKLVAACAGIAWAAAVIWHEKATLATPTGPAPGNPYCLGSRPLIQRNTCACCACVSLEGRPVAGREAKRSLALPAPCSRFEPAVDRRSVHADRLHHGRRLFVLFDPPNGEQSKFFERYVIQCAGVSFHASSDYHRRKWFHERRLNYGLVSNRHFEASYCSGPMKFKFPFELSLSKPFDRLRANGSYFTGPDQ